MNNKILVKLIVPELNNKFDIYIPVNEVVWKVKKLVSKAIYDITYGDLPLNKDYVLINKNSSKIYDNNEVLINTDIRNSEELLFISVKDYM